MRHDPCHRRSMKIDRQDKPITAPALTLVSTAADRGDDDAPAPSLRHVRTDDAGPFMPPAWRATRDEVAAEIGVDDGLVVLIEGESGAGKTVFLRALAREFAKQTRLCHLEVRLALGERHVLSRIAEVYGCPPAASVGELASLLAREGEQQRLLIIVDNADRLSRFALRALLELQRRTRQGGGRIALVLGARSDGLEATLALPSFAFCDDGFLRRIELPRFSEDDTAAWLHELVAAAGLGDAASFDDARLRRIHRAAHGLPREIRRVADDVLNGRRPRRWRSRRDESRARRLKVRLTGAAVCVLAFAVIGWLLAAQFSGPPRLELAFESPVHALPDSPSLPLLPAVSDALPPPPPPATEAAASPPTAVRPDPAPASPAPRQAAPAPVSQPPSATALTGRAWLMAQAPDRYTVQIASSPERALAQQLIERNQLGGNSTVIGTRRGDRTVWLVVHGSYGGPAEAREAIASLPPQIRRNDPFARTMQSLQAIAVGQ